MDLKEPIEGLCNQKEVYALLPMKGQQKAECPLSKEEVRRKLQQEVAFLKEQPQHNDKGMVNLIINCRGEVVQCMIDIKTKSSELDAQIVSVFKSLGDWKPGKLNGKKVDSSYLWSFTIVDGQIRFD